MNPRSVGITPEYVSPSEASALTSIPLKTLEAMRSKRIGPPFVKIGSSVRYPLGDLRAWMQSRLVRTEGGAQ
nr:helix-turn-helix domain-containing protein [Nitrosomonas nitrosa]